MKPGQHDDDDCPATTRRQAIRGAAVTCLPLVAGCLGNGNGDTPDDGHDERADDEIDEEETVYPLILVDPEAYDGGDHAAPDGLAVQLHVTGDHFHWHHVPLEVPLDGDLTLEVVFHETVVEEGAIETGQAELDVRLTEDSPEGFLEVAVNGTHLTLSGVDEGEGGLVFSVRRDAEVVLETRATNPLDVEVVELDDPMEKNVVA